MLAPFGMTARRTAIIPDEPDLPVQEEEEPLEVEILSAEEEERTQSETPKPEFIHTLPKFITDPTSREAQERNEQIQRAVESAALSETDGDTMPEQAITNEEFILPEEADIPSTVMELAESRIPQGKSDNDGSDAGRATKGQVRRRPDNDWSVCH